MQVHKCIQEIKISKHELRKHGKHLSLKHLDKIEQDRHIMHLEN